MDTNPLLALTMTPGLRFHFFFPFLFAIDALIKPLCPQGRINLHSDDSILCFSLVAEGEGLVMMVARHSEITWKNECVLLI